MPGALAASCLQPAPPPAGLPDPAEIGIRPEHVAAVDPSDPRAPTLTGVVQLVERLGNLTVAYVETPAGQIVARRNRSPADPPRRRRSA